MYRRIKNIKIAHSQYLLIAILFICFNYYVYQFHFAAYFLDPFKTIYFVIVHFILFMMSWSMGRTVVSDPGKAPGYWGFLFDDPEHRRKRYCLVCHNFKPERCHHCQYCSTCVLNMDHHCPWLNNCVGFHNRKFFMLMLLYINILVFLIFIAEIPQSVGIFRYYGQISKQFYNNRIA
ncbi:hypothetical protein PPERSA_00101 [Pseudocohnilembus persalinus]|uniref:Palmitoyltransferase n=1 Tax=Pseudocohnilembus persalinus TaxID=266149 RepID=A0A0V0Q8B3_PSEPJ|nr:hypothetical protein PPERSA_00101 [Pseudocohnilembus persalinus]|eukprot:KRW98504.1 hypothetical protein PPERSA_00101 [Pseudocohnilembus persalinus]